MSGAILLTGASGFIGQHVLARLLYAGRCVRTLGRTPVVISASSAQPTHFEGTFLSPRTTSGAFDGVDVLIHLAATTTPGASHRAARFDLESNVLGTVSLLDFAVESGVRRIVFVSSGGAVYGSDLRRPASEDDPTLPISAYGIGKLAIEHYLRLYRREYDIEVRVARGANPFGEHQAPWRGQGFVSSALWNMRHGKPVSVWGDGTVSRDFFYVGDLAAAIERLIDDQGVHEVYNIGSGVARTVNEMIGEMEAIVGRQADVRYARGRPVDVPYSCLNVKRAEVELDWKPLVPLEDGLERTWRWITSL